MNDFEDVDDMSFVMDSNNEDEENGEGSQTAPGTQETQGTINNDEEQQHELEHDLQPDAQPPAPERLTPSQDHDFQSQAPVVVRPMLGPGLANIPEPRPQNVETEESTCSICFEHWTNSGSHRLVSIKCGHLFGESCILKWMAQRGRGGCAKCPECNHPAMRKDVRRIWSKSVVVVDTAEKDEAVARAKKEQELRLRCEQELVQSRMAYEMLRSEMTRLQNKHDRQRAFKIKYRSTLNQRNITNTALIAATDASYAHYRTIAAPAMPAGTAQYMSFRKDEEMFVCTRQINEIHGVTRVSMRDFSLQGIIPIHTHAIRDLQCYTYSPAENRSLVLTASMDKTLKVTSTESQSMLMSYDLKAPVWSCCWSASNPFAIYCSVKGKETSILTLDLRFNNGPVASCAQTSLVGHSPIHSMTHIGLSPDQKREGILCGNLEGAFLYNFDASEHAGGTSLASYASASQGSVSAEVGNGNFASQDQGRRRPFRLQGGSCSSVSFDAVSRRWMASYKFLGEPYTRHVRGHLDQDQFSGDFVLKSEYRVVGGPPAPCMSRSSVFSRCDGSVCMAAGSEGVTYIWSGAANNGALNESGLSSNTPSSSQQSSISMFSMPSSQPPAGDGSLQRLLLQRPGIRPNERPGPIKDVKAVVINNEDYVVTLSDQELEVYRWSEARCRVRVGDEELEDSDSDEDIIREESRPGAFDKGKRRRMDDDILVLDADW